MKIKTSELEGVALDWAVAKAVIHESWQGNAAYFEAFIEGFSPSTDWSQGGPLIDVEVSAIVSNVSDPVEGGWWAHSGSCVGYGPTPLIAACRAIVSARLGDEVEIPDELA